MDDTRQPTQNGQTDVDQEVRTTSALQENTQRRQDDGENDLADIAADTINYRDRYISAIKCWKLQPTRLSISSGSSTEL